MNLCTMESRNGPSVVAGVGEDWQIFGVAGTLIRDADATFRDTVLV